MKHTRGAGNEGHALAASLMALFAVAAGCLGAGRNDFTVKVWNATGGIVDGAFDLKFTVDGQVRFEETRNLTLPVGKGPTILFSSSDMPHGEGLLEVHFRLSNGTSAHWVQQDWWSGHSENLIHVDFGKRVTMAAFYAD